MKLLVQSVPLRYLWHLVLIVFIHPCCLTSWSQSLAGQFDQNEHYRGLYLKGEYQAALDILQKEIDARPELAKIKAFRYIHWLSDRAEILFKLGRVDEAIADLEIAVEKYPEPAFIVRLAKLYRYRGRMDDHDKMLELTSQTLRRRWTFHPYEENILALAQISEMRGENPKQLLSTVYTSLMENAPNFSGGFIGAGDLAYKRGAYDLSNRYYQKANELSPGNQEALAGLAETYWKSSDPRLEKTLNQLLEVNPHNFRAIAIQAELLLDRGNAQEALELLEKVIKINPNQLRIRSLQAAAYFLLDDDESMERVRKHVLNFNPTCSEVDYVSGRIASRHYRFHEGIQFQRNALETNPDDVKARTQYGLDLLRLGEDEKARVELERAFADDPYNVTVFNLLNLLDSLAEFDTIQQDSFVIRFPKDETAIWSDEALSLLEETLKTYQTKYKIDIKKPVHVQIFDNHDDFMVRSTGLPGAIEFMGICFGELITMDSPSARTRLTMNWRSVLWHEFVHVITLQKTNNRIPRWLSEGISVYEETQKDPAWGQKLKPEYKPLIETDGMPGVSDLENFFVQPKTPNHMMLGYYLSGEFVHFYITEYGIDSMVNALDKMRTGEDAVDSLAKSCQKSITGLDKDFKRFLEDHLQVFQNLPPVQNSDNIIMEELQGNEESEPVKSPWFSQPSPFTDAMQEGTKAMAEERWEDAVRFYEEAFSLYPDYTGAAAPLRQLTEIYRKTGNTEKLTKTFWRRLAWDSTDFGASQELLNFHIDKKEWEHALKAAHYALSIDPFHLHTRESLLTIYKRLQQHELAIQQTHKLEELDPSRKIDFQMERIQLLIRLKEIKRAKTATLLLLEKYPHLWKAQEMLLAITENHPMDG